MIFKKQYDDHERFFSNPGSREKDIYKPFFDDNGVMDLRVVGKENLYDFIQSHADSVNIHLLLQRFNDGDVSVLSRTQGVFGDFTDMPKTYAEALNSIISAENYFNGLPLDVRAKFGHSFQQFLASMDKSDFLEKMQGSKEIEPATPQKDAAAAFEDVQETASNV